MARRIFGSRKQRTRQHVIADLSVHHVEGFILEEGHTAQRLTSDYGYDLILFTYDAQGYVEPGLSYFQLKAKEKLEQSGTDYIYDLDIRDYNLWMLEEMPVILVLFEASRRQAWWLPVQDYFREEASRKPGRGAKSVRVRVTRGQVMNLQAIARIREIQRESVFEPKGERP
jgi:hypothetical protein